MLGLIVVNFFTQDYTGSFLLILLSIATAFMTDALRRGLYSVVRQRMALAKPETGNKKTAALDPVLLNTRSRSIGSIFRIPYMRKKRRVVFISYTHASEWAVNVSESIYKTLTDKNIPCFLDRHVIKRGSSWHRCLIERMDTAFYMICLVDEHSVNNEWPAEELETALRLKSVNGSPIVYLLKKSGVDFDSKEKMPIFDAILQNEGTWDEIAFVLNETDETPMLMASQFQSQSRSSNISNSILDGFGSLFMDIGTIPLFSFTLLCMSFAFIPLGIAAITNFINGFFYEMIEKSETAAFVSLSLACYLGTIFVIDVLARGFIFHHKNEAMAVSWITSMISAFISVYAIFVCIPEINFTLEKSLIIIIIVTAAIFIINSIHEYVLIKKDLVYGNDL
jgi:hypothetical protein